mgnify:CR=1 FL=1
MIIHAYVYNAGAFIAICVLLLLVGVGLREGPRYEEARPVW